MTAIISGKHEFGRLTRPASFSIAQGLAGHRHVLTAGGLKSPLLFGAYMILDASSFKLPYRWQAETRQHTLARG
ncbi:hypothetical protein [Brucella anthropi]|uniref:hypothetical protein n=1 Tax=Brucella anthropi TaxID=529 RepID=UPI003987FA29